MLLVWWDICCCFGGVGNYSFRGLLLILTVRSTQVSGNPPFSFMFFPAPAPPPQELIKILHSIPFKHVKLLSTKKQNRMKFDNCWRRKAGKYGELGGSKVGRIYMNCPTRYNCFKVLRDLPQPMWPPETKKWVVPGSNPWVSYHFLSVSLNKQFLRNIHFPKLRSE